MITLFEKINPEILEAIESDRKNHPRHVERIILKLKNSTTWLDLTVLEVSQITDYVNTKSAIIDIAILNSYFKNK